MSRRTVIVGAGLGGVQTAHWLRAGAYDGDIVLIGDESELPYHRPPLSKHVGDAHMPVDALRPASYYADHNIELRRGERVMGLDLDARVAITSGGERLWWSDLVLATGAAPRELESVPTQLSGVHVLRTAADARALWGRRLDGARIAVVGAGFVGLEFAAAATKAGAQVTVVEMADQVLGRAVSAITAAAVHAYHRELGVDVLLREQVQASISDGSHITGLALRSGRELAADCVLVAVGAVPRTDLAAAAGLRVDDGIAVDSRLRASVEHVYAIGDCASWVDSRGQRRRLESVQNAGDQAAHVARQILGSRETFTATPWFWSDQGALRLQIVGVPAASDATLAIGTPGPAEATVLRHAAGVLTCVESLGRPADHLAGRRLIGRHVDVAALASGAVSLRDLAQAARSVA